MLVDKIHKYCFRCGQELYDGVCDYCWQEYQTPGTEFQFPSGYLEEEEG